AAIETQGYTQVSNRFYHIAYLVAPTPPYLLGTLEITFVGPYCGPACTPAIRVERFDASVQNSNGNCVWKLGNN
ncbi:MAG TPA: hypothetical protein VHS96_12265, partial [Bacteroidia bacterium]|nr:hypothetical protein [Bacteroidia bacterium]